MKSIVYLLLIVLFPLQAIGQNYIQKEKPFWADGYFREMDNSYIEVVNAFGYDLDSAKDKAVKEIISRRSLATGAEATVSINQDEISVISGGRQLIVKARIIEEYVIHTTNGYTVYLLVQTAKNPTYTYEEVTISDKYGFSARAFIPGMAQIYKGSTGKGLCIIAAAAAAIAGIIFTENERASYESKMHSQPEFIKQYKNKRDNFETARNCCIGAAAAIYIYNLIDAIVARGDKRIIVKPNPLHVSPMASTEYSGITLSYHF